MEQPSFTPHLLTPKLTDVNYRQPSSHQEQHAPMLYTNNYLSSQCSLTKKFSFWQEMLEGDFDAPFLLDGIYNGFKLINFPLSDMLPSDAKNYKSALCPENKSFLDTLFRKEIALGRFTKQTRKPIRIQSIGAVPKKDSKVPRPITDCSRPFTNSLNSYLYADKFNFCGIDQAVLRSKPFCYYGIVDIESAYRWVPIYPPHSQLQGFRWQFEGESEASFYVDNFLCFGLNIAPAIFNRISTAIVRMMTRAGHTCLAYLDDFLVIAEDQAACRLAHLYLIHILIQLGFAVNWAKIVSATQRVCFLGLIIDSANSRVELPLDKLEKLRSLAADYILRTKVTKRELQVLTGHMAFASRAIYGARPFTRIFIDAVNGLKKSHYRLRLSLLHKSELAWWVDFAGTFNGLCPCNMGRHRPVVTIYTDASFTGFGAVKGNDWLAGVWANIPLPSYLNIAVLNNFLLCHTLPASFDENINYLELVSAILALLIWAPALTGAMVMIYSDNQSTVAFLNKCTAKNADAVAWLKEVFYASLRYDFRFSARHTPGITNTVPDALSRLTESKKHLDTFINEFSHALPATDLPPHSFSYAFTKTSPTFNKAPPRLNGLQYAKNKESTMASV